MPWRLLVIDGADAQRFFPLPEHGTVVVGNSHRHADICLNDLVMGRVHCEIGVDGHDVTVTALADDKPTQIDGQPITTQSLSPGQVLRIGNTRLRLELDDDERPEAEEVDDDRPKELPAVTFAQMDQLVGHTLGHFDLLKVLGRGHTAVTFLAHDNENHREVALKVIGPNFPARPEELQQFARVIRQVATIREEHLVTWYAAGKSGRFVWIAQELVEGESLAHILERNQTSSVTLKWRNALKLAVDLGKALDCLHHRRIVHGNLSPANVMIRFDRTAKLNDLMYEQAMKSSQWYGDQLEEKLLAELPYMAPERLEEGAFWDEAADIYSLGALVYARLTGRPPFEGRTPGELIESIQTGRLIKPRDIIRGCPEAFQVVVLKMLAHNQEDRYQTPEQLVMELEGVQTAA